MSSSYHQPTGCYICGQPGHWSRDCPSQERQSSLPGNAQGAPTSGVAAGGFARRDMLHGHGGDGTGGGGSRGARSGSNTHGTHGASGSSADKARRPAGSQMPLQQQQQQQHIFHESDAGFGNAGQAKGGGRNPVGQNSGGGLNHGDHPRGRGANGDDNDDDSVNSGGFMGLFEDDGSKRKRSTVTIRRQRPKLTNELVLSKAVGIPYLLSALPSQVEIKGRGHEVGDLQRLLEGYMAWHKRVFPSISFQQFIEKLEKMGRSRRFQTNLRVTVNPIRIDSDVEEEGNEAANAAAAADGADAGIQNAEDAWEEMMRSEGTRGGPGVEEQELHHAAAAGTAPEEQEAAKDESNAHVFGGSGRNPEAAPETLDDFWDAEVEQRLEEDEDVGGDGDVLPEGVDMDLFEEAFQQAVE